MLLRAVSSLATVRLFPTEKLLATLYSLVPPLGIKEDVSCPMSVYTAEAVSTVLLSYEKSDPPIAESLAMLLISTPLNVRLLDMLTFVASTPVAITLMALKLSAVMPALLNV